MATKTKTAQTKQKAPAPEETGPKRLTSQDITNAINQRMSGAPDVYADTLLHLALGPYVCKAIVGTLNPSNNEVASMVVLNMPGKALLDMAIHIIRGFSSEGMAERIDEGHKVMKATIEGLSFEQITTKKPNA